MIYIKKFQLKIELVIEIQVFDIKKLKIIIKIAKIRIKKIKYIKNELIQVLI